VSRDGNANLVSDVAAGNQWYKDGNIINGATAQTYKPTENGFFTVKITQNGCTSAFSENYYYLITALVNLTAGTNNVQVYPNPSSDLIRMDLGERPAQTATLRILNPQGMEVHRMQTRQQVTEIRWPGLISGTYLIEVTVGIKRYMVRVVKID
jgi:hypothetical protein